MHQRKQHVSNGLWFAAFSLEIYLEDKVAIRTAGVATVALASGNKGKGTEYLPDNTSGPGLVASNRGIVENSANTAARKECIASRCSARIGSPWT